MISNFLLVLVCTTNISGIHQSPDYVGVLENHDSRWPSWPDENSKEKYRSIMRVVFVKTKNGWGAVEKTPAGMLNWNIGFDGKRIGKLKTVGGSTGMISEEGLHVPAETVRIPMRGAPTLEFGNWADGMVPRYRPLVATTSDSFADPQDWRPEKPTSSVVESCIPEFRKQVGSVILCDEKHGETPTTDYTRKSILLDKCYSSKNGDILINLTIDPEIFLCDWPIEKETSLWFHVDTSGKVRHLNVYGRVVDAGDYDGDGDSEIVFAYSGYNKDGYTMLYDNLSKRVQKFWNYH